jgi:glutamate synthase domain-containing protein 3
MHLELEGEANDYVAKGLTGGEIAIRPFRDSGHAADQVLLGNTALYGATGGRLFAAGRAGDRFAVRNSGATAVVEGAGAHCCEYMTAGIVVVLGSVGRNFGAGMSNGVAYVLDEAECLPLRINPDAVALRALDEADEQLVLGLVREHLARTASPRAQAILAGWERYRPLFRRATPHAATVSPPISPAAPAPPAEPVAASQAIAGAPGS